MAITSGFFDSVEGDRLYNAEDVNGLLDGVISDGILNYGGSFLVSQGSEVGTVNVASGKAWLLGAWVKNDDTVTLTVEPNATSSERFDTVVVEINKDDDVRSGNLLILAGNVNPISNATRKQIPIAQLTIEAGSSVVTDITDVREGSYAVNTLVIKNFYPVGSVYISTSAESPSRLFGGTWQRLSGRFLIGCGGNSGLSNGDTGGSWTHTLQEKHLPRHSHVVQGSVGENSIDIYFTRYDYPEKEYTVMGWANPISPASLGNKEHRNYLPASYNFEYSYNGSATADGNYVKAPSAYSTDQCILQQVAHSHDLSITSQTTGSGSAITIKPPYLAVYMWERVS